MANSTRKTSDAGSDRRPTQGLPYKQWLERAIDGSVPPPPVAQLVGFRIVEASNGVAVAELEAGPQHWNPMGTLHGGILCDVADAAMGSALGIELAEGETFTTLELSMRFIRPVWTGKLRATGRVVRKGRTVSLTECDVTDAEGRLVARASSTCMILRGDDAQGR